MNTVIKRAWNKNKLVKVEDLTGMTFQAESGGHTFEISGVDDTGAAVSLSGTVEGRFLRADNAEIIISGTASSGKASVTLSEACYAIPGRFLLTVYVTSGGQKVAVYAATGSVVATSGTASGSIPPLVTDSVQANTGTFGSINTGNATVDGVLDVTQRRCYATLSSPGWYRVMNVNFNYVTFAKFSIGTIVDIAIGTEYWANDNETHKISLYGIFNNPAFVGEESKSNNMLVDKVRYTYDTSGNCHIDIHYIGTSENPVWCSFTVHTPHIYQYLFVADNFTSVAPSPNGETVLPENEYTFTANGIRTVTLTSAHSSVTINGQKAVRSGNVVSLWVDFTVSTSISGYGYMITGAPSFAGSANALVYDTGNTVQTNVRLYADEGNNGLRCYIAFPAGRYIAFITYITTDV